MYVLLAYLLLLIHCHYLCQHHYFNGYCRDLLTCKVFCVDVCVCVFLRIFLSCLAIRFFLVSVIPSTFNAVLTHRRFISSYCLVGRPFCKHKGIEVREYNCWLSFPSFFSFAFAFSSECFNEKLKKGSALC